MGAAVVATAVVVAMAAVVVVMTARVAGVVMDFVGDTVVADRVVEAAAAIVAALVQRGEAMGAAPEETGAHRCILAFPNVVLRH